jgi:hypothetical protein
MLPPEEPSNLNINTSEIVLPQGIHWYLLFSFPMKLAHRNRMYLEVNFGVFFFTREMKTRL